MRSRTAARLSLSPLAIKFTILSIPCRRLLLFCSHREVRILRSFSLVALFFGLFCAAHAQSTAGFGSISGTVRDASGAAVPNAKVVVSNQGKGITRNLTSNDSG